MRFAHKSLATLLTIGVLLTPGGASAAEADSALRDAALAEQLQ